MIEISGWLALSPSSDGEHSREEKDALVSGVEKLIKPMQSLNQFLDVRELNGNHFLFIGINHSHDNGYSEDVEMLIEKIGEYSKGSYGIVHFRDHDSPDGNFFRLIRLAKGKITKIKDELLSPCNPIIED